MRIDPNQGLQPAAETGTGSTANAAGGSTTSAELGNDQAQLSGSYAQVEALTAQAAELPETRNDRVESLRQLVDSGRYSPSPENVAGALLTFMVAGAAA